MRIALPVSGGLLCHFGHCERFYIFDVYRGTSEILKVATLNTLLQDPGLLPILLSSEEVNVVIAGGMGEQAQEALGQKGIRVVVGVDPAAGSPEDIVESFLAGSLREEASVCALC